MVHQMDDKMLDTLSGVLRGISAAKWQMANCERQGLRKFQPTYLDYVKKLFFLYPNVYPASAMGIQMIIRKRVFLGHFFIERKGTVQQWHDEMRLNIEQCISGEY